MVNFSTTILFATISICSAGKLVVDDISDDVGNCRSPSKDGDTLNMHYTGTLASDGTQFDSSIGRGPFEFVLGAGGVIKGWDQGLGGMCPGDKRKLTIPPELGYGDRGAGAVIPPGATLVFEVQLVGIERPEPETPLYTDNSSNDNDHTDDNSDDDDDDDNDNNKEDSNNSSEKHLLTFSFLLICFAISVSI